MSQRYEGAVRALSRVMAELNEARAEIRRLALEKQAIIEAADETVAKIGLELRVARKALVAIEGATLASNGRLREIARDALPLPKPKRGAKATKETP